MTQQFSERQQNTEETPVPAPAAPSAPAAQHQVDTSGLDDLLADIDSVLESNAEDFVRGFVQKGGQ